MIQKLKVIFNQNQYPTKEFLNGLVKNSEESIQQIQRWFRAERKKNFDMGTMNHDVNKKYFEINNLAFVRKKSTFQRNRFCS